MARKRVRIGDLLIEHKKITNLQLQSALEIQRNTGRRIGEILIEEGLVTEDDIMSTLEQQLGIERVDLSMLIVDKEVTKLLNESICKRHIVFPFGINHKENKIKIAFADPLNIFAIDDINFTTGLDIEAYIARKEDIETTVERYYSGRNVQSAAKELSKEKQVNKKKKDDEIDDIKNAPAVKMVDQILTDAIKRKVSDIHIEPYEEVIRVRYRIDGMLKEILNIDIDALSAIITRIKILADMNIAERRIPQDGRIVTTIDGVPVDMRVSSIPLITGEKVVIRILDKSNYKIGKEKLGMSKEMLKKLDDIVSSPYGIILVTGPTGSGKSTTLYTVLAELNDGKKNITTIEDPVEYTVEGINQVHVNSKAGLTFAAGLRSMLRQDPDIIMIGEMRDSETAQIGVRAAITGHLVLSTLHTNDAASSILRLVDMGVEPYLAATAIKGVIAQRLVRKICPSCKEEYQASDHEKEILGLSLEEDVILSRGKGCVACGQLGYKGRIGVYEVLQVDRELKDLIITTKNSDVLKDLAVKKGMKTLAMSCQELVLQGLTSISELISLMFLE
ncbi:GspE/PulE family protein [Clostridium mediterraneense]|uniref:GspE/PulE family protein n=1 Tax=Clostridium mediterraneense TaxID=1805472 RepID=UPI000A4BF540|nr:ATPase, T2SS/T4P/T4SS family [Clostridium mediterraneense]